MQNSNLITVIADRKKVQLDISKIKYIFMNENVAEIHVSGGNVYKTRITMKKLEDMLGDDFIKIHRSYLVSVKAIHDITDKVVLSNGETLNYVTRKKKALVAELQKKRHAILERFSAENSAHTEEEYRAKYQVFDDFPIAFTDIEMLLDEKQNAVDWVFRYGNEALAKLEKIPLDKMIGRTFSSIFPNMDEKWLRSYERAALYGQTLEIIDYSPEIDTYLDIICFPTQKGHCGCILLDIGAMQYADNQGDSQNARLRYFAKLLEKIG